MTCAPIEVRQEQGGEQEPLTDDEQPDRYRSSLHSEELPFLLGNDLVLVVLDGVLVGPAADAPQRDGNPDEQGKQRRRPREAEAEQQQTGCDDDRVFALVGEPLHPVTDLHLVGHFRVRFSVLTQHLRPSLVLPGAVKR